MKKALVIIDYIHDFVDDKGNLTCGKPAQEIESNIVELIQKFKESEDFVVNAFDCHEASDGFNKEREMFPLHCHDEQGRALYGQTQTAVKDVLQDFYISIPKNRYSAFCGTPLDLKLKERNVQEIHFVGVCSDICVLHSAIDAYNLGYKIVVHSNAIASFNRAGHEFSIEHFENVLGATVL